MSALIQEQVFELYNNTNGRMMLPGLIIPAKEARTTQDSQLFVNEAVVKAWRSGDLLISPDPTKFFSGETAVPDRPTSGGGGGTGDLNYIHTQNLVSAVWNITHNLDKFPSITVIDSSGAEIEGYPTYVNSNVVQLNFSAAFSGVAYLN